MPVSSCEFAKCSFPSDFRTGTLGAGEAEITSSCKAVGTQAFRASKCAFYLGVYRKLRFVWKKKKWSLVSYVFQSLKFMISASAKFDLHSAVTICRGCHCRASLRLAASTHLRLPSALHQTSHRCSDFAQVLDIC